MSISYELYNAPPGYSRINEWEKDESLPIARPEEIKDRIMRLYSRISSWSKFEDSQTSPLWNYPISYSTIVSDNCSPEKEYLDITIMEHKDGYIHFVSARGASPKLVRELLEEFQLPYAFEWQSCRLIDPYKYTGNWEPVNPE